MHGLLRRGEPNRGLRTCFDRRITAQPCGHVRSSPAAVSCRLDREPVLRSRWGADGRKGKLDLRQVRRFCIGFERVCRCVPAAFSLTRQMERDPGIRGPGETCLHSRIRGGPGGRRRNGGSLPGVFPKAGVKADRRRLDARCQLGSPGKLRSVRRCVLGGSRATAHASRPLGRSIDQRLKRAWRRGRIDWPRSSDRSAADTRSSPAGLSVPDSSRNGKQLHVTSVWCAFRWPQITHRANDAKRREHPSRRCKRLLTPATPGTRPMVRRQMQMPCRKLIQLRGIAADLDQPTA